MPSFLATSSAHPMLTSTTTHVTLSPSKPLISFISVSSALGIELSMASHNAPSLYGHKSDASGAFVGMAFSMSLHRSVKHALLGEVSVDEGDYEAMFFHAARELHHWYDVPLCRVGKH
ncbi:hypothetical protein AMTRI_Chr10g370 [Amborella trichopoda]